MALPQAPFLLDVTYHGKFDSDAWRAHYCRQHGIDPVSQLGNTVLLVVLALAVLLVGPVLLGVGLIGGSRGLVPLGGFLTVMGLLAGVAILFLARSWRAEKAAFHALAQHLVLVDGVLTECKGEMVPGDEEHIFMMTAW
jgi:hypothetical protein